MQGDEDDALSEWEWGGTVSVAKGQFLDRSGDAQQRRSREAFSRAARNVKLSEIAETGAKGVGVLPLFSGSLL